MMSIGAVLYAGNKARRMAIGLSLAASQLANPVTEQDVERGFRQLFVTTNVETAVMMPTNAVAVGKWHVRGAYKDRVYIPFGDFDWIVGSNAINRVSVFTGARARPTPRDSLHEISAVGGDLLAIQGRSTLWYQEASGQRTVGWYDFSPIDDTNASVNASITWYADGMVRAFSNGVEKVYGRVSPVDWDGDGLLNAKDDDPFVYNGDFFGPENILPAGCNSNAYCTISVVATGPDAEVRFEGDGPSNYPDPHFMAKAGATNVVYILIGKAYSVSSDQPIAVVGSSDLATDVWVNDSRHILVIRPVEIAASRTNITDRGGTDDESRTYSMTVMPPYLAGEFVWATDSCCEIKGIDGSYTFACEGDCICSGCTATGSYVYEGYEMPVVGAECGCASLTEPRIRVKVSPGTVIFEGPYTNCDESVIASQSSIARIELGSSHCGEGQIVISVNEEAARCLEFCNEDGVSITFPYECNSAEKSRFVAYAKGIRPSSTTNSLAITALFTNAVQRVSSVARMGSVKVSSKTYATWPEDVHRKEVGVGESVAITWEPELWSVLSVQGELVDYNGWCYEAPHTSAVEQVELSCGGACYNMRFSTVEPEILVAEYATGSTNGASGVSGDFTGYIGIQVAPTNVSFSRVAVVELPRVSTNALGFFARAEHAHLLDHGRHGAGVWHRLRKYNDYIDKVSVSEIHSPEGEAGSFTWPIPNAWRVSGDLSTTNVFEHLLRYDQRFELLTNGAFRIKKMERVFERLTNDVFSVREELDL